MRLRTWNHRLSPYRRQQACGRQRKKMFGVPATVKVRRSKWGTASFHGLVRCGSKWACPVCAYVIDRRRAEELRTALTRHARLGGGDCHVALTTSHDQGTAPKPLRQHVARAWQACISGASWKRFVAKYGVVGNVRGAEVTYGPNGSHPHLHVVLFTRRLLNAQQRDEIAAWFFQRWQRAIAKPHKETGVSFRPPLEFAPNGDRLGVTCTTLGREDYIAKLGLADEIVSTATKGAHAGHRTPFQVLRDIWAADGTNEADNALWKQHVEAFHGAKALTWSRGLRDRYGKDWVERDLDVVEQDDGGQDICDVPDVAWERISADVGLQIRVVQTAENCPVEQAADELQRLFDEILGLPPVPF